MSRIASYIMFMSCWFHDDGGRAIVFVTFGIVRTLASMLDFYAGSTGPCHSNTDIIIRSDKGNAYVILN